LERACGRRVRAGARRDHRADGRLHPLHETVRARARAPADALAALPHRCVRLCVLAGAGGDVGRSRSRTHAAHRGSLPRRGFRPRARRPLARSHLVDGPGGGIRRGIDDQRPRHRDGRSWSVTVMKRPVLILPLVFSAACGPTVDLGKAVAPESVTTGWADGGTVAGKHKIVPVVSFKLKNVSDQELRAVQVNAVFRRVNDPSEWSAGYLPDAARTLPPGAETPARSVAGQQGY